MRMKRWLASSFIALYLAALGWGIIAHAATFYTNVHPAMYFVVWDMFCGYSHYEKRVQVIGEGESGAYYELAPGPWGDFYPFGDTARRHYDIHNTHTQRLVDLALNHTTHEPMTRVFTVEQWWPKRYNLPDWLWQQAYDEPKDVMIYSQVRRVATPDGQVLQHYNDWLTDQWAMCVMDNPRLEADRRRGRPLFALNPPRQSATTFAPVGSGLPQESLQISAESRLAN